MKIQNFSLGYMQPSGAPPASASGRQVAPDCDDPWAQAVHYYGTPVLRSLQSGGAKTKQELYDRVKEVLGTAAAGLTFEQFNEIVSRMIRSGRLARVREGEKRQDDQIALPIPQAE
jgi:hypothetical protein